jgi:CheY-like chemotaxis protein
VEDDPDTREILVEFFESLGYDVTAVATAEAGLEKLQHRTTDIVLSDNQLDGGRSGAWMLERAYKEGLLRKVGAVLYTADSDPHVPRVVRVLHKPAGLQEIETIAESAADSARARNEATPPSSRW